MDDTFDRIRQLVDSRRTIDAIKLYREATGVGLKEAKDAIDRYAAGGPLEAPETPAVPTLDPSAPADAEIMRLLEAGRKFAAVKVLRAKSGLDLAAAKDAIDKLERDMRRARGPHAGRAAVVQRSGGTLRWAIVVVVIAAAIAAYFLLRAGN